MCRVEYAVRPVSLSQKGGYGVYEIYATDKARILFEGTFEDCHKYLELVHAPVSNIVS